MDIQVLLVVGAVIVAVVMVVYWQRQGVVKRPSIRQPSPNSETPPWRQGVNPASGSDDMDSLGQGHIAQIQSEIERGRKINAIKIYRQAAGVDLKTAKEAVEAMMSGRGTNESSGVQPFVPANDDRMAQVRQALQAGNKIEAIKLYREVTRTGLKEAKDAVDALERNLGSR